MTITSNSIHSTAHLLSSTERYLLGAISFLCLLFGLLACLVPSSVDVIETDRFGLLVKLVSTQHYLTDVALLLIAVGLVIGCFAINGARLSKLSIGSASVEAQSAPQEAKEFAAQHPAALQTIAESVPSSKTGEEEEEEEEEEEDSPSDDQKPSAEVIYVARQPYQVYEGIDIPIKVLAAMFDEWAAAAGRWQAAAHPQNKLPPPKVPKHLSEIQFAARRAGKGNFPWLITFKNAPPIRVALGGKGKPGATVDFADEILMTSGNPHPADR